MSDDVWCVGWYLMMLQALPIFLDDMFNEVVAVLLSVTFVLAFGEVHFLFSIISLPLSVRNLSWLLSIASRWFRKRFVPDTAFRSAPTSSGWSRFSWCSAGPSLTLSARWDNPTLFLYETIRWDPYIQTRILLYRIQKMYQSYTFNLKTLQVTSFSIMFRILTVNSEPLYCVR